MDVITLGDFAITNRLGNTKMSFRVLSLSEVDYVKQINSGQTGVVAPRRSKISKAQIKAQQRQTSRNQQGSSGSP